MVSEIKKVGYVGLGLAGGPLAQNVALKGYRTIVRDADKNRQRAFVEENKNLPIEEAPEGPEGFTDVDVLITMVPNGHIVRDILLGDQGIAPHMKPGTYFSISYSRTTAKVCRKDALLLTPPHLIPSERNSLAKTSKNTSCGWLTLLSPRYACTALTTEKLHS